MECSGSICSFLQPMPMPMRPRLSSCSPLQNLWLVKIFTSYLVRRSILVGKSKGLLNFTYYKTCGEVQSAGRAGTETKTGLTIAN